mgnify:CR=1 FL=1
MIHQKLLPLDMKSLTAALGFRTVVTMGKSGRENRNANWQAPRRMYNASVCVKTYADILTLNTFFQSVKGRLTGFLIKDYLDYSVDTWTTFTGTRTGSSEQLQLFKLYEDANLNQYSRTIYFPLGSSVSLQENGVDVSSSNFSVSETTGIVTYTATASSTVTFKISTFYTPVRFDTDDLNVTLLQQWLESSVNFGILDPPSVPMIELRLETISSTPPNFVYYGAEQVYYGSETVVYG